MVFSQVTKTLVRRFTTNSVKLSQEWQQGGVPGSNLPFNIHNKKLLTVNFILFFGSGLSVPFVLTRRFLLLQYADRVPVSAPAKPKLIKPVFEEPDLDKNTLFQSHYQELSF
ncbi:cytochrome c oxidase subunit 7C, mitochondrial-like [Physella acuta]|uniref:cytochrome c oxidase subunit 7C, mitochondrial-like n=1 Tax=Physella acuta TaxID=109671 RepID=UPI0027DADC19|nr:cytochrome c oxidase subunit 7C, mitochondrial-like [Physella acuta]